MEEFMKELRELCDKHGVSIEAEVDMDIYGHSIPNLIFVQYDVLRRIEEDYGSYRFP